MKGDFSRDSFDPRRGYQALLHQQGRAVLDADLNEQVASQLHLLRRMALDLIGPHGGPAGDAGFEIMLAESGTVLIGPGRYYAGGVMVENERLIAYDAQPFRRIGDATPTGITEDGGSATLVYLDVFERAVSAFEDPNLTDPALDDADISLRRQTVWHVRSVGAGRAMADIDEADVSALLEPAVDATPLLAIRAAPPDPSSELAAEPGYSGMENRLFRIELHRGGAPSETQYKWSRENGRIVGEWRGFDGNYLLLSMRDPLLSPRVIELTDGAREAAEQPGELAEIEAAGSDRYRIIDGDIEAIRALWESGLQRPFARRWEKIASGSRGLASIGEIELGENHWTMLGDGLEIAFAGGNYTSGDYWQLAVRPGADLLWPGERDADGLWRPRFCASAGVTHWRAPLALVGKENGQPTARDLRRLFEPRF